MKTNKQKIEIDTIKDIVSKIPASAIDDFFEFLKEAVVESQRTGLDMDGIIFCDEGNNVKSGEHLTIDQSSINIFIKEDYFEIIKEENWQRLAFGQINHKTINATIADSVKSNLPLHRDVVDALAYLKKHVAKPEEKKAPAIDLDLYGKICTMLLADAKIGNSSLCDALYNSIRKDACVIYEIITKQKR